MNKVVVVSLNKKYHVYEKKIKIITQRSLSLLKKKNCYLEIFLINSRKMKILNKKFRHKNKTTEILTFVESQNFPHPESKLKPLGEIYLNAQRTHSPRFAGEAGQRLSALLAHGLLHLMGFQHKKKNDRIKMEETEQKLLRQILNPKF